MAALLCMSLELCTGTLAGSAGPGKCRHWSLRGTDADVSRRDHSNRVLLCPSSSQVSGHDLLQYEDD